MRRFLLSFTAGILTLGGLPFLPRLPMPNPPTTTTDFMTSWNIGTIIANWITGTLTVTR